MSDPVQQQSPVIASTAADADATPPQLSKHFTSPKRYSTPRTLLKDFTSIGSTSAESSRHPSSALSFISSSGSEVMAEGSTTSTEPIDTTFEEQRMRTSELENEIQASEQLTNQLATTFANKKKQIHRLYRKKNMLSNDFQCCLQISILTVFVLFCMVVILLVYLKRTHLDVLPPL